MTKIISSSISNDDNTFIYDNWNLSHNRIYNVIIYINYLYSFICINKNKPNLYQTKIILINNENNFNFTSDIKEEDLILNINNILKKNNNGNIYFTYFLTCDLNQSILKNMFTTYSNNNFINCIYKNVTYKFSLYSDNNIIEKCGIENYCYIIYIIKLNLLKMNLLNTNYFNNINIEEINAKGCRTEYNYKNSNIFEFNSKSTYNILPYFDKSSMDIKFYKNIKNLKHKIIKLKKKCNITKNNVYRCYNGCSSCCRYIIGFYNNKIPELKLNKVNIDNYENLYFYDAYTHII